MSRWSSFQQGTEEPSPALQQRRHLSSALGSTLSVRPRGAEQGCCCCKPVSEMVVMPATILASAGECHPCVQAEQRQQHFEQSAGGRAAKKAMADVAKDRQSAKGGAGQDNARDWLS